VGETSYSSRLRTGVLLCGSGTAGAYHAGALRAILEAGIKIDVIAAHGAGVLTALAASVDGGARVWDAAGPWTDPRLRGAYRWRAALRWAFGGLVACLGLLLSPFVVMVIAAAIYAVGMVASLVSLTGVSASLVDLYGRVVASLFDPPILPTIVPRVLVLAVLVIAVVLAVSAVQAARRERSRRHVVGAFWWRLVSSPLDGTEPAATAVETLWRLVRGASNEPRPTAAEIGRRYVETTSDSRDSTRCWSACTTSMPGGISWARRWPPRPAAPSKRSVLARSGATPRSSTSPVPFARWWCPS
jgi:hypothetical protein